MAAYFTNKVVDDMEQLAVVTALKKCMVEYNQFDDDVSRLLDLLHKTDSQLYSLLTEFIASYRSWALFCEGLDKEGNGGKLQTKEQQDKDYNLKMECENNRIAFLQMLSIEGTIQ